MKKNRKKILATTLVAGSLLAMPTEALANNYTDTRFSFHLPYDSSVAYTNFRQKMDRSKCYIKCTDAYLYFYVKVEGATSASATSGVDCSHGNTTGYGQIIYTGTETLLTNRVYEKGYRYARLKAHAKTSPYDTGAYGVWSPDNYAGVGN